MGICCCLPCRRTQQAFFEQEEQRVGPVLRAGLEHAQQLAEHMSVSDLISELSQGTGGCIEYCYLAPFSLGGMSRFMHYFCL